MNHFNSRILFHIKFQIQQGMGISWNIYSVLCIHTTRFLLHEKPWTLPISSQSSICRDICVRDVMGERRVSISAMCLYFSINVICLYSISDLIQGITVIYNGLLLNPFNLNAEFLHLIKANSK